LKIVGIDLAGKTANPTGICIFNNDEILFRTLYSDEEILQFSSSLKPDIIAIDAPLIIGEPRVRKADKILKRYGALPPTWPSMKHLTQRGSRIATLLENYCKVIEVFPTATAKILGIYDQDYRETAKTLEINVRNKHELDAYLCCITAKMFLEGKTVEVGDEKGKIIIPRNI